MKNPARWEAELPKIIKRKAEDMAMPWTETDNERELLAQDFIEFAKWYGEQI